MQFIRPANCLDGSPSEDSMNLTLKFTFVVFFCAALAFTAGSLLASIP
jgi:hypothetical protein